MIGGLRRFYSRITLYLFQVLLNQEKVEDWRFEEILLQGHVVSVSGLVELGEAKGWEV